MINFYGKIGDVDNAANTFNNIAENKKDIVTIGAMMKAYYDNEEYNKSLNLFHETKENNKYKHCMNDYLYVYALWSAGDLVSIHNGSSIIDDLNKPENSDILNNLHVQSAIITMYAKCNKFEEAINVFNDNIINDNRHKDGLLQLYSSMMDCYNRKGDYKQTLLLFNDIKNHKQFQMDDQIYYNVINACSRSGLVDDALLIFQNYINNVKKNNPSPQIINGLIDCLGRNGGHQYLDQAENLYTKYLESNINLYYKQKIPALLSLLLLCRIHNDMIRGERIANKIESLIANINGKNG